MCAACRNPVQARHFQAWWDGRQGVKLINEDVGRRPRRAANKECGGRVDMCNSKPKREE